MMANQLSCYSVGIGYHGTELLLTRLLSLNSGATAETIPSPTEIHNINIRARFQETQHIFKHIDVIGMQTTNR
jgi:hypothetical protein